MLTYDCDWVGGSLSASVCVVKVDGAPYLCKTDEVGEVCVSSSATGTAYYGLPGVTKNVFEVCTCALQWSLRASVGAGGRGPWASLLGCSAGSAGSWHRAALTGVEVAQAS